MRLYTVRDCKEVGVVAIYLRAYRLRRTTPYLKYRDHDTFRTGPIRRLQIDVVDLIHHKGSNVLNLRFESG
jgi:hypothetical protein